MNEPFEYLQRRVETQRAWHNKKAHWNKVWYYRVEVATLLAGAAVPIVLLWAADDPYWARVIAAVLGGVVVVATAVGKLFKFQENWLQYRTLVENLDREEEHFRNGAADYATADAAERNRLFVERVENVLASTTAQYVATHRAAREAAAAETQPPNGASS